MQQVAAALIVVVLVGLALYFGRQQLQTLRWLRGQADLPPEDRLYHRRQAWLRLANSLFMVLLAALVAGYYLLGVEARVEALADLIEAQRRKDEALNPDAEQAQLMRLLAGFCIAVLGLLMAIVFLVAVDVWSIRRYGRRHMRQIQADRKAMVETQISRLRSERNGHG